jgi:hypothetical protein
MSNDPVPIDIVEEHGPFLLIGPDPVSVLWKSEPGGFIQRCRVNGKASR